MFWIVWAVVGLVVWGIMSYWQTGALAGKGWWASLIAALVGSWLGDLLLGDWGWLAAGYNVIAGAIGAIVLTWLWSLVSKKRD
ncbi:GlsB/YeaQ/YmgE family stress response membrane protein [Brevibacillus sp. SYP-B805]|uniref:GlsB/YeaQ/YmgE family stress response membrane protein n=1 Tax=Brevibacillus sp. SYP-B805 TaxID=1578199 RepID=UPI0013ECBC82|nr:GlsB/YeaQ/YmgE family stress response membrane protein [Brevibacillus sp. SYP-B805]NGQ96612.1 GlsB/YeaQ/YmgE family stress response membrane protein [Brevibacillus sp. SYP-B805]